MNYVVVVGFHHTQGSQVEFLYPDPEPQEFFLPEEKLNKLAEISLPDGSHLTDSGYVYFTLADSDPSKEKWYCISCYRQIKSSDVRNNSLDVSRSFIQKAVVVLSKLPLFGELRAKL